MSRLRAFTILELLIVGALFSLLGVLSFLALKRSSTYGGAVSSEADVADQLSKACQRVRWDLARARFSETSLTTTPAYLAAGGSDGSAVWFLSAEDPATGAFAKLPGAEPFWQKNVLYYLVTPSNHQSLFGIDCRGHRMANGFDDGCPHKVLVRKVIDSGVATTPSSAVSDQETLLSDVSSYLTRPSGIDAAAFAGESNVVESKIIAKDLVGFTVELAPDPSLDAEVLVSVIGANRTRLKSFQVGTAPLTGSGILRERKFSVFPGN